MSKTKKYVLVVDDEPDIRELLEMTLARMDVACIAVENIKKAKACLAESDKFFLCLADMRLPDGDGIELVEYIQEQGFSLPVAVITAFGNVEGAVNTLKAGAFDYVSKPVNLSMLRELVNTALRMENESSDLNQCDQLLGASPLIKELQEKILKLARSQAPVFIYGESGTGKELVARLIHQSGPRKNKPFVPVNCGAIPSELMESEFFGYKKGSFTGAISDKEGLFQAANGGTLFLDEIAEMPIEMQVKLLRCIQEKTIRSIGSQKEMPIDVRILSASHKDLQQLVKENKFRQDLFYRINVIELSVPGLAQRKEDIPLLVEAIVERLCHENDLEKVKLTAQAIKELENYSFPGNVRELENILERAITLCENHRVEAGDLELPEIQRSADYDESLELDDYLDNQEREVIRKALEKHKWNRTAAAKSLGISFRALRYRLKKLNLE